MNDRAVAVAALVAMACALLCSSITNMKKTGHEVLPGLAFFIAWLVIFSVSSFSLGSQIADPLHESVAS